MKTPKSSISQYLLDKAKKIERLIVRRLSIIGEECITISRDRAPEFSWYDQTGNLRSSVGYVIVHNGKIVLQSGFEQIKAGTDGPKEGVNLAKEIAAQYMQGYALIVVAGMEYAAYVEAMENKDVLTSAELYAERQAPIIMQGLADKLKAA